MRRARWAGVTVLALVALAAGPAPKESKAPDLPGSFHPYNVTGPRRGYYHCPVSDRGLEPLVLLLVRNLEATDPLRDLLQRLDQASENNPRAHLGIAAVFLTDDLPDIVGADDKSEDLREKLIEKLSDLDTALKKPIHVSLCLTAPADLKAYQLPENAEITVILCRRYQVLARHVLTRDQLTQEMVNTILTEVADKLGAVKRAPARRGGVSPP